MKIRLPIFILFFLSGTLMAQETSDTTTTPSAATQVDSQHLLNHKDPAQTQIQQGVATGTSPIREAQPGSYNAAPLQSAAAPTKDEKGTLSQSTSKAYTRSPRQGTPGAFQGTAKPAKTPAILPVMPSAPIVNKPSQQ